ncbi:MAG: 3-dehydroquinate synthase [Clostridia bacterium]|nr:3-dehydroquinate synthase [Clostridia bacterium]
MDKIVLKSKLYDYTVEFIDDFKNEIEKLEGNYTFVIDKNVYELYKDSFEGISIDDIFLVEPVESRKNIEHIMELIYFWQSRKVKKNWKVVCVGGGITQDIATFASNIFLRNMEWYFFPTTLLAMCDSCIGGKCGINLGEFKNQLGVFYPPKKIFIYTGFLNTLTKEDYVNGWGELLKFSLTSDENFYREISSLSQYIPCKDIDRYIHMGLMVKKDIIEKDEFEGDLRRVLNYGHTFGHALESYTKNEIPHGTAVIWGIDVVNYLSYKYGILDKEVYDDVKAFIKRAFIAEEIVIKAPQKLFDAVKMDKKVKNNTVFLALLDRLSNLIIHPVEINDELYGLFCSYLEETHEYYRN